MKPKEGVLGDVVQKSTKEGHTVASRAPSEEGHVIEYLGDEHTH